MNNALIEQTFRNRGIPYGTAVNALFRNEHNERPFLYATWTRRAKPRWEERIVKVH